jgi:hypothetical protein
MNSMLIGNIARIVSYTQKWGGSQRAHKVSGRTLLFFVRRRMYSPFTLHCWIGRLIYPKGELMHESCGQLGFDVTLALLTPSIVPRH